jgi:hypothetical protein
MCTHGFGHLVMRLHMVLDYIILILHSPSPREIVYIISWRRCVGACASNHFGTLP